MIGSTGGRCPLHCLTLLSHWSKHLTGGFGDIPELLFKNCIKTLANEAAILVPEGLRRAVEIFSEILHIIARIRYYRAKNRGPSRPGVRKRPPNKWYAGRREKLSNA